MSGKSSQNSDQIVQQLNHVDGVLLERKLLHNSEKSTIRKEEMSSREGSGKRVLFLKISRAWMKSGKA